MGVQALKRQGNYIEEQLYSIIVNSKCQPDLLAISLYSDIRSWFKTNKYGKSKLKNNGYKTSYEELAKKYKRSKELIKQKIVFLESLGLLSRDFRIEYIWGQRQNNVMYLLVWKNTPYFYSEIGIDHTIVHPANLDKKTWNFIQDNPDNAITTPSQKIEGGPVKKTVSPPLESSHIIYSNTTLKTTINNTDLSDLCSSEDMSLGIENQNLKNQDNIITKQAEQMDIHTKNGNVYYGNRLLNEFDFTDELIDAIRQKSDKPHFSNDRIKAIMRNIVASNPKVRIWGGRNAFINYMVKAVNNEKEFTKEEKSQSLAEMKRREAEKLLWQFENKIITYF
jgi:hypothetical protein